MPDELKKCPMCAEEIPLAATTCEFCGAPFEVTRTGYCQNCHEMRPADENGSCMVCGNPVLDLQLESKFKGQTPPLQETVRPVPASTSPASTAPLPPGEQAAEWLVLPIRGEGVSWRWNGVFIDWLILTLVYSVVVALGLIIVEGLTSLTRLDMDSILSNYGTTILLPFPVIWFLYFFIFEAALGATPGKAASHLRVIKKGGGRIAWWQAALRALLGIFEYNLIGAIVIWSTRLKQRIGDLLAGTLVVHKEKVHRVVFTPPAITFEFHDYRRVKFARITEAVLYKFVKIHQLELRGLSENGSPLKVTLRGYFFPQEFEMLRLNLEQRLGSRFPEKIIVWRLVLAILSVIFVLAWAVVLALVLLDWQVR